MPECKSLMPFFRTVIMDAGNVCWCSFHDAHKLCSCQDAPLSFYILIVQGVKNAVNCIIKGEDGKFDWILGPGSAEVNTNVIDC
jgi:hypothetical protein